MLTRWWALLNKEGVQRSGRKRRYSPSFVLITFTFWVAVIFFYAKWVQCLNRTRVGWKRSPCLNKYPKIWGAFELQYKRKELSPRETCYWPFKCDINAAMYRTSTGTKYLRTKCIFIFLSLHVWLAPPLVWLNFGRLLWKLKSVRIHKSSH